MKVEAWDKKLDEKQAFNVMAVIGCALDELDAYEEDYLLLDDAEADARAMEYIKDSLWAFNPDFLAGETSFDVSIFKSIQENDQCESNNDAVLSLVEKSCGLESLVESAVGADGRGHFLAQYDFEEHEIGGDLYLYRVN